MFDSNTPKLTAGITEKQENSCHHEKIPTTSHLSEQHKINSQQMENLDTNNVKTSVDNRNEFIDIFHDDNFNVENYNMENTFTTNSPFNDNIITEPLLPDIGYGENKMTLRSRENDIFFHTNQNRDCSR